LWRKDAEGHPLCNMCGMFLKLHGIVRPLSLKTDCIEKNDRQERLHDVGTSPSATQASPRPALESIGSPPPVEVGVSAMTRMSSACSRSMTADDLRSSHMSSSAREDVAQRNLGNATKDMLTLTQENLADITPRSIYESRLGEPARPDSASYEMSTLRRSPSISSITSVHSEVSEHDSNGNLKRKTITTTNTTYYQSESSTGSPAYPYYRSASATDYSTASDIETGSTRIPRSTAPAPQSMMTMFSSKLSVNTQKKHKCKVCDKRFTRPSSLQTHMYSHTGEKPFACKVPGCGRHFSVVSNLRRHGKTHKTSSGSDGDRDTDGDA